MKLFQNPSTDLAEVVKSFLFIVLEAILFNVAKLFEQFWVNQKTFLYNYFKIHLLVQEKLFKGFFYFKLWRPSCSTEGNGLSNFGRGSPKESSCKIISKSMQSLRRISRLKVFLFVAMAVTLFNGEETV